MDNTAYQNHLESAMEKYEALCKRCGECCGTDNDPCSNLILYQEKYYCKVYKNRLGPQETVSGKFFSCVSIKDNIKNGFTSLSCPYIN